MAENWKLEGLERRIEPLERRIDKLEEKNRRRQEFWQGLLFWGMLAVLWAEIGATIALAAIGHKH